VSPQQFDQESNLNKNDQQNSYIQGRIIFIQRNIPFGVISSS
jgi:hypothetical protein